MDENEETEQFVELDESSEADEEYQSIEIVEPIKNRWFYGIG